jgi:hypothetical protein
LTNRLRRKKKEEEEQRRSHIGKLNQDPKLAEGNRRTNFKARE